LKDPSAAYIDEVFRSSYGYSYHFIFPDLGQRLKGFPMLSLKLVIFPIWDFALLKDKKER
jgi:hypothetical protein